MFPELTIRGAPYARGRQYGVGAARQIRHSVASYARLFAHRRGLDWAESQAEALRFVSLIQQLAPDLLEEMVGIADGSGLQLGEIVALNVRTELMAGIGAGVVHPEGPAALARNRIAGVPQHVDEIDPHSYPQSASPGGPDDGECTTAAAAGTAVATGGVILAQTWDWPGDQRAACLLLRIQMPGEPEILTMTEAGILAKIGMNSAGLAVALNMLRSKSDGQVPGMPIHVLLRKMLQADSIAAACRLTRQASMSGSSCITVASADGELVSLEITPNGVAELRPEQGLLAHANHYLDSVLMANECSIDPTSTTRERYGRTWELLRAGHGRLDVAAFIAILTDHVDEPRCICRHPDPRLAPVERTESICGILIDLGAQIMHIAADVPCQAPFVPVGLWKTPTTRQ